MSFIKEFKAPILFLVKFLILYLVLNLAYGLFIDHYSPKPDPVTQLVTKNTDFLLRSIGYSTGTTLDPNGPYVVLNENDVAILSVYEGCNGVNVAIIFMAFLLSFGRVNVKLAWFVPLGLALIHIVNLLRIGLLFYITKFLPGYLYFTHKYLFTAIIYVLVFLMWYLWLTKMYKYRAQRA